MKRSLPALTVFLNLALCAVAQDEAGRGALALVEDGKALAKIVIAANPPRYTQIAALELQHYVRKMSGATLPITTDQLQHVGEGYAICVGASRLTEQLGYRADDFAKNEYLVETRGNWLILMGRDEKEYGWVTYDENGHWPGYWPESFDKHRDIYRDHASSWAVYDFLEKYCGVRWYLLTELGEVVPERKTITVANIHIRRKPWASLRRFNINGVTDPWYYRHCPEGQREINATGPGHRGWRKLFMWLEHMRFGGTVHECTHSLYSYYDRFGAQHPDWFANSNAVYGNQLCFSNEEVTEQVARDICDYFDGKYPGERYPDINRAYWIAGKGDFHAVVPMDNADFCNCPGCQGRWKAGQEWMFFGGYRSDYVWDFVNRVARKVAPHHPDKYISALAYWQYTIPPSFPIDDNIAVMYCKSSSQYNDPRRKAFDRKYLPQWRQRTRHLTIWEYYNFPRGKVFPGIQLHRYAEEIKYLHDLPIEGIFIELDSQNIALEHLNIYFTMKLLDDPDADIDTLLDEYYRLFYGPAEIPMRHFFEKLERIYTDEANWKPLLAKGKEHLDAETSWEVMCLPTVLAEFGEIIDQTYAAVGDEQPHLNRVKLMDRAIYQWMKLCSDEYWQVHALRPDVKLPRLSTAPIVDGSADDACWVSALATGAFRGMDGGPIPHATNARIGCDSRMLYIVVQCRESMMETVIASNRRHDGNVFEEPDSIELFFDLDPDSTEYYQIAFNVLGTINDAIVARNQPRQQQWQSQTKLALARQPDGWTAEMAIPFTAFGYDTVPSGKRWRFNVCRNRKITDARKNKVNKGHYWEYSAWSPTITNWHERKHYARVQFP